MVLNECLTRKMLNNAIAYAEICGIYVNRCKFLHMWCLQHNFRICDFENAIMCGKIRDLWFLAVVTHLWVTLVQLTGAA